MRKFICMVLAAVLLFASAALAEDLSAMTDDELKVLIMDAYEELLRRGLSYNPETAVSALSDETFAERVTDFYTLWSRNDLDGMMALCDPAWEETQENAKLALFAILANRTPVSFTIEQIHDETDGTRTAIVTSRMDRHNGKDLVDYRNSVVMNRREDGLWYLDPRCLRTYEPVEGYSLDLPEPTPEETGSSELQALLETVLFYVPDGGEYYHVDSRCPRVAEKYLPMKGVFSYMDLNYDEFKNLKPCAICGAPTPEYAPAELTGFFLKIFDRSGLGKISYLRADVYEGDERRDFSYVCPEEEKDFHLLLFETDEENEMRFVFSYGVSDLPPEEAVAEMLKGAPVEEHELLTLSFVPEGGKTYCLNLETGGEDGITLAPAE